MNWRINPGALGCAPRRTRAPMSEQAPVKKYSVFLPKTDFPMKADLPQREPKRLERWKAEGLYQRIEARRKADNAAGQGRGREVLHDGPPYANGAIHMGHALNKICLLYTSPSPRD